MWPPQVWYRPYPSSQGAGHQPYMYTEYNPPYEWQMPQMPPQMPPQMHPAYTQQQHHQQHQQHQQPHYRPRAEMPEPDVMLSGEVRIARGFNSLVKCMLRKMTRSLAQSPVEMSVVPFAAFEAIATQPSSSRAREADREDAESALDIRGSAPSVLAFPVHVPTSIEDALTKQMEFVDWMITQSATNVHHSHHASFHAALLVVRGELRFTRLVHRHAAGASLYNGDKELQPVPDFDSALAGLDHCTEYVTARRDNPLTEKDRGKKALAEAFLKAITELKQKLEQAGPS